MAMLSVSGYLGLAGGFASGIFAEVTVPGYSRLQGVLTAQDDGSLTNRTGLSFGPDSGTPWGLITWLGLFDAPTGGNLLLVWPVRHPRYAGVSATLTIPSGAIRLFLPRLLSAALDTVTTNFLTGTAVGYADSPNGPSVLSGTVLAVGAGLVQAGAAPGVGLLASNNLSEIANPALARAYLNQGDLALPFSTVVATDGSRGNVFNVTLTGNAQLGTPTNLRPGASYVWRIIQDQAGGRTMGYAAAFKFPSGVAPVLTATAGAVDILSGISDGQNIYANIVKDIR